MQTVTTITSGIKKYKGKWTINQASHLAKRTMFGATKQDVAAFAAKSLRHAIDDLIETQEETPLPPVNAYNDVNYVDIEIPQGATWVTATKQTGMEVGRRKTSYKAWWTGLMLNQQRTLREKMVLFWHNHFSTESNQVDNATASYKHNILLRQYALGNFKSLVKAVTVDACMLRYLNGNSNTKKAPDENYGRELQELFTVGKGPGSGYTEDDVKAAAKVLTGFRVEGKVLPDIHGLFDATRHDETDKQFSAFYNNTIIKGRKGKEGEQELDDMLDMIFQQEEVSKFICRKLYRYFVYYKIDDGVEKNIIVPLAKTFRKSNYEIKPVLNELLSSQHFFDAANSGSIIKNPVDFCVGLCREFNVVFPDDTDIVSQYNLWNTLQTNASQMQMNIGDPPNVAGWPAYYQAPNFDKVWVNSDTLPKRNIFSDKMVNGGYYRGKKNIVIDVIEFTKTMSNPAEPLALINESIQRLYQMDLPDKEKIYMKNDILLSGLQGMMSDHYWTDAWNKLTEKPDDVANKKDVTNKLKNLYKYLMNLPQYQLC